jgi:plasmid replication initiation protein
MNDLNTQLMQYTPIKIKKSNGAIHSAINTLSASALKLNNILIRHAADKSFSQDEYFINIADVYAMFDKVNARNHKWIESALKELHSVIIQFNYLLKSKPVIETLTLLSGSRLSDSVVSYRFDPWLVEKYVAYSDFTNLNLRIVNVLKKASSIALYENCFRFVNVGSTGALPVLTWRQLLGAMSPTYSDVKNFNRLVLNPAIKEVNEKTDIFIKAEITRKNKVITHYKFLVKRQNDTTIDSVVKEVFMEDSNVSTDFNSDDFEQKKQDSQFDPDTQRVIDFMGGSPTAKKNALSMIERHGIQRLIDVMDHVLTMSPSAKNPQGFLVNFLKVGDLTSQELKRIEKEKEEKINNQRLVDRAESDSKFVSEQEKNKMILDSLSQADFELSLLNHIDSTYGFEMFDMTEESARIKKRELKNLPFVSSTEESRLSILDKYSKNFKNIKNKIFLKQLAISEIMKMIDIY